MVAKGPVSVNWQTLFILIPYVGFWASYRIQKLRLYLLIFVLFAIPLYVLNFTLLGTDTEALEELYYDIKNDPTQPNKLILWVQIFSLIYWIETGLLIYLIRKWSKKWNEQFVKPTNSE